MDAARLHSGVRSVQVALDILEAIAFCNGEIGVSQIAAEVGLAKGATFRHLSTLVGRGYVVQNPATSRYQIGIKFELLSRLGRRDSNLFTAAEAPMTALRDAVGETIVLSAFEQSGPVVLATITANSMIEIGVRPGSKLQFGSSAQGKIMLAFGPQQMKARFARNVDPKKMVTLDRELSRARRQGWLEAAGDVVRGINAIAAPIFDASALCVGTVAIVGLFNLSWVSQKERYVSGLMSTAERISVNIGNRNYAQALDTPRSRSTTSNRRRKRAVPS